MLISPLPFVQLPNFGLISCSLFITLCRFLIALDRSKLNQWQG